MTRITSRAIAQAALPVAVLLAAPSWADPASITVRHVNLHPVTAAEARHSFLKIDDAALRVCGASGFSLAEAKAAMRASPCWREAAGVALRSGNPLLAQAFARFAPPETRKAD